MAPPPTARHLCRPPRPCQASAHRPEPVTALQGPRGPWEQIPGPRSHPRPPERSPARSCGPAAGKQRAARLPGPRSSGARAPQKETPQEGDGRQRLERARPALLCSLGQIT